MKNVVTLQKLEDVTIYCRQITELGKGYSLVEDSGHEDYWEPGGTIVLDELEEILDKEI